MDIGGSEYKHVYDTLKSVPMKVIEEKHDALRLKTREEGKNLNEEQHFSSCIEHMKTTDDIINLAPKLITAGETTNNFDGVSRKQCSLTCNTLMKYWILA